MSVDFEALQTFIDESFESLQTVESDFIQLENDPANQDIINRIFRPIHSLKGNSGFFGLVNINKFSHRLENLLDLVRKGEVNLQRDIVDILLEGIEVIENMLNRAQTDPADIALRPEEESVLVRIESYRPEAVAVSIDSLTEMQQLLHQALESGIDIYAHEPVTELLNYVAKSGKTIHDLLTRLQSEEKQTCRFSSQVTYFSNEIDVTPQALPLIQAYNAVAGRKPLATRTIKDIRGACSSLQEVIDAPAMDRHIEEIDAMANFLDDELMMNNDEYLDSVGNHLTAILSSFQAGTESTDQEEPQRLGEILLADEKISPSQLNVALGKQKKIGEILLEDGAISDADLSQAVKKQQKQAAERNAGQFSGPGAGAYEKTIRISQTRLDQFAESIGELFINLDSFNYLKKMLEADDTSYDLMSKYTNTVTTFDDMVSELHDHVMAIRKIPINTLFQRFPKVVRQLAGSIGKEVDLVIRGEETIIDKDLIEKMENPLVHILRNAIDHGIESPESRVAAGKKRQGIVELTCTADEDYISIKIYDDGAGIDPVKMKRVARKKQLLPDDELENLSDKQLINLIFAPGFSSAEKISDISGRGVGMDVVLSGLKECNGTIDIESKVQQGTSAIIKIPLTKTLVAKEAMIVQAGKHTLAVDSADISTTSEANIHVTDLMGEQKTIQFDGRPHKVVHLENFLFQTAKTQKPSSAEQNIKQVFIISETHQVALLVDQVLSHQKIVVKDFQKSYYRLRKIRGIKGYSILGNQDIALIIDMKSIADNS